MNQQIIQACHAANEAGKKDTEGIKALVLCETPNEASLLREAAKLSELGIPYVLFQEDLLDNQATAIATVALDSRQRKKLKDWQLWNN